MKKANAPPTRPEGLTDEEYARFVDLALNYDVAHVEAEMRDLLAHPEAWLSAQQVRDRLAVVEQKLKARK